MTEASPDRALGDVAEQLRRLGRGHALVGGLAVSLRAEVRFTRDVELAIDAASDEDVEQLVRELRVVGYEPLAVVDEAVHGRLAIVRLRSPSGVVVVLLAASSGIEAEIIERASSLTLDPIGPIPVARAEELLALKILSMTNRRLQDRIDAVNLIRYNESIDLDSVRHSLELIKTRGDDREQDLGEKLRAVLELVEESG